MKNATVSKKYRQGDVMIDAGYPVPVNAAEIARTDRGVVLAEGEVTGHAHRIPSRSAMLFRSEEDARFMRVMGPAPVSLGHEEHTAIEIPPGEYNVRIHTEYSPGELPRQVED